MIKEKRKFVYPYPKNDYMKYIKKLSQKDKSEFLILFRVDEEQVDSETIRLIQKNFKNLIYINSFYDKLTEQAELVYPVPSFYDMTFSYKIDNKFVKIKNGKREEEETNFLKRFFREVNRI